MKKITFVVLTYNNLEKATKPMLRSLYKYTDKELFELVIVDNNSVDGTKEFLKNFEKKYDNVKVIYNRENLGYSKGNNQGIKLAKTEFIGLLNNDILFSDNWLCKVLDFYKNTKNAGFVSPSAINKSENKKLNINNYLRFIHKKAREGQANEKVLMPEFCCAIVPKYVLDKIGIFNENFTPCWFEDDDLSIRACYGGFQNYILGNVFVFHNNSTTTSKVKAMSQIWSKNKKYYFEKDFMREYTWTLRDKNKEYKKELDVIKKSPFYIFIKIEKTIKIRFEKLFRGLIKKFNQA